MDTIRHPGGPLARATARAVAWNYLAWFLSKVLVLGTTAVLARLLTPDDFGIVGFATVAVAYLAVFRDLGLGGALIQRRDDVDEAADTVFTINLVLGAVLTAFAALAAPWIAGYFGEPRVTGLLRVLGLSFFVQSLGTTHLTLLQRDLAFRAKLIPDVGQAAVRMAVSIGTALAGWDVWALVAGQLAGVTASSVLAWVVIPWRPRLRPARRLVGPLSRFGAPLLGVDVIHTVVGNLDYVVVGKVLGAGALGLYTLAYRLPELLLLSVVGVLSKVFFPALATVQHDVERLRSGFFASIRYVQMFVVPVGLGLAVAAEPIVLVILGTEWLDAVPVVRVLAVFALVSSSMVADGDVYKAMGRPGILTRIAVLKLALLMPALSIGVQHGLVGVALAHLVTAALVKGLRGVVVARMLGIRPCDIVRAFGPSAIAGTAMVAAVLPVLAATEGAGPTARLTAAAAVGAASYGAVLLAMERRDLAALVGLFRAPNADQTRPTRAEESQ